MVRDGDPAGAEDHVDPPARIEGADYAGRELGFRERPLRLSVEGDLIGIARARFEPLDADQRVVVALDAEGARAMLEHLHLTGPVGLDPDHGLGVRDVAKDWTEDQLRHALLDTRIPPSTRYASRLAPRDYAPPAAGIWQQSGWLRELPGYYHRPTSAPSGSPV